MTIFDASALLAMLNDERGADAVVQALERGDGRVSAANWSEVAQKVLSTGADWGLARAILVSFSLVIEPVTAADAETAASLWRRGEALSLGDRLCLALGARLHADVLTADAAWAGRPGVGLIR